MYLVDYACRRKKENQLQIDKAFYEGKLNEISCNLTKLHLECNHELVLLLGQDSLYDQTDDYAVCICCGNSFRLNFLDDDEQIPSERIIDIRNEIGIEYRCLMRGEDLVLVSKAREMFDYIALHQDEIALEDLKDYIKNHLILFTKEEEKRLKNKRESLSRKRAKKEG